ncbi:hypothetical protein TcCL_ESM01878 [Trypanosoma cruzi]|nr:hypothetical protein TcCL_ESM01878 [Trypanosoma cruzi]
MPAEPGSGVNAELPLRTVPVGRFSQCPVNTVACRAVAGQTGIAVARKLACWTAKPNWWWSHRDVFTGQRAPSRRPDPLPSWNRRQRDVNQRMFACHFRHTVHCFSLAFSSCAEAGFLCGFDVLHAEVQALQRVAI